MTLRPVIASRVHKNVDVWECRSCAVEADARFVLIARSTKAMKRVEKYAFAGPPTWAD